jgi:nickel/cobalt transporter (NicO) family protein
VLIDALALGAVLGVRHALEPDHLAAITAMTSGTDGPRAAARTGAAWGLGHAIAVVVLGGALIALGVKVPVRVAIGLEVAVALMLIVLGAHALRTRRTASATPHGRSTLVGFIHGASGTAAITVICATTFRSAPIGLAFLVVFALGATLSMSAMSGLLATPLSAVGKRSDRALRMLRIAGALAAFGAAAFLLLQILRGA